jgi:Fe-Mn family superoxide dismutase
MLKNLAALPESHFTAVRNNTAGHGTTPSSGRCCARSGRAAGGHAIADATRAHLAASPFRTNSPSCIKLLQQQLGLAERVGKLVIHSTANRDTPSMEGKRAVFGLDVWSTPTASNARTAGPTTWRFLERHQLSGDQQAHEG